MRPLSAVETRQYITHHLRHAGGDARAIFRPQALRAIYTQTGGVPSRINIVCDRALLTAYVAGRKSVDRRIVRGIVRDLHLPAHHRFGGARLWLTAAFLLGFIWANPSVTMRESTLYPERIGHLGSSLRELPQTFSPRVEGAGSPLKTTKEKQTSVSASGQETGRLPGARTPRQSEISTIVPDRDLVSALFAGDFFQPANTSFKVAWPVPTFSAASCAL